MLARADYFVGSYHSRWAKLVEGLRHGLYQKDRATSVDASVDHADLYSIIHRMFHRGVSHAAEESHCVFQDRVAASSPHPKCGCPASALRCLPTGERRHDMACVQGRELVVA